MDRKLLKFSLFTLLFLTQPMQGFVTPSTYKALQRNGIEIKKRVVRPVTRDVTNDKSFKGSNFHAEKLNLKADLKSNTIRILSGKLLKSAKATLNRSTLIEQSLEYVESNFELFGVERKQLKLVKPALLITDDVQFLRFDVYKNGLRVEDASIDFRYKKGILMQVVNMTFAEAPVDEPSYSVDPLAIAQELDIENIVRMNDTYRILDEKRNYRLIPVANLSGQLDGEFVTFQVNLSNGKVYEIAPKTYYYDGKASASIYPRYYQDEMQTFPLKHLELKGGLSEFVTDEYGIFSFEEDLKPKIQGFNGSFVNVRPSTGSRADYEGDWDGDTWAIKFASEGGSSDKFLAQAMIYVHAQKMIDLAKEYIQIDWFNSSLRANANLSRSCNAHWDGLTINFYSAGRDCANTGLISDVVYHEWGHGLDANTGGIDDGAFSEGFSDIMSLLHTRSNLLGIGFRLDGSPVRDIEPDMVYPQDASGGVHSEGLIIGGTFWDLFKDLREKYNDEDKAVDILSNLALKVIFTARRYTDVYEALLVIDDDDTDLSNGTPHMCIINKNFSRHGLTTELTGCKLATIHFLEVEEVHGNSNNIPEPGEEITLAVSLINQTSETIDTLEGAVKISNKATGDVIYESTLYWDELEPRSNGTSRNNITFIIPQELVCGTEILVELKLKAGDREVIQKEIIRTGTAAEPVRGDALNLPLPIQDLKTTQSITTIEDISIPQDTIINKLRLRFDIAHTYRGDLSVHLESPDGQKVRVYEGNGGGEGVNFDSDVSELFDGATAIGDWTLTVYDRARRDQGSLESFSLEVTPHIFTCN